jgi:hypothetical protein
VTLGRFRVAAHLRGGAEVDRRRPVVLAQPTVRQRSANEALLPLKTTTRDSYEPPTDVARDFRFALV